MVEIGPNLADTIKTVVSLVGVISFIGLVAWGLSR